jgi:hypothetical protein
LGIRFACPFSPISAWPNIEANLGGQVITWFGGEWRVMCTWVGQQSRLIGLIDFVEKRKGFANMSEIIKIILFAKF